MGSQSQAEGTGELTISEPNSPECPTVAPSLPTNPTANFHSGLLSPPQAPAAFELNLDTLQALIGSVHARDGKCTVCYCEISTDESILLHPRCGYGFHCDCLEPWLAENCACPCCRQCLKGETSGDCEHTRQVQESQAVDNLSDDPDTDYNDPNWEEYLGNNEWNGYFSERDACSNDFINTRPGWIAQQQFRVEVDQLLSAFHNTLFHARRAKIFAIRQADVEYSVITEPLYEDAMRERRKLLDAYNREFPNTVFPTMNRHPADERYLVQARMVSDTLDGLLSGPRQTRWIRAIDAAEQFDRVRAACKAVLLEGLRQARAQLAWKKEQDANRAHWEEDPDDPQTVILMLRPDEYEWPDQWGVSYE